MVWMISFALQICVAYGLAFFIARSGGQVWLAVVGFAFAFLIAWLGGTAATIYALVAIHGNEAANSLLQVLGRGFWCALIGAVLGVRQARNKPTLEVRWLGKAALGVGVVGVIAAVVLPALRNSEKANLPLQAQPSGGESAQPKPVAPMAETWGEGDKEANPVSAKAETWGEGDQQVTPAFIPRARALKERMKAGDLPFFNAQVAHEQRSGGGYVPSSAVQQIESGQTWWVEKGSHYMHVVNTSRFTIASLGVEKSPAACEKSQTFTPYFLQLEYLLAPGQEAVVVFSLPGANPGTIECLNVVSALTSQK